MIIAEVGINHNGDMELARMLIEAAYGADLVKFQLYDAENIEATEEERVWLKKAQLDKEQAFELFNYGKEVGIEVFFSVYDIERVAWCEEMGVKRYKIACTQNNNINLLEAIPDKCCYISYENYNSHTWLNLYDPHLLYCIPEYPSRINKIFGVGEFRGEYGWAEGFSDHTIGIEAAMIALARGAEIIEKHFTFNHFMEGPDHIHSMTPDQLEQLVEFSKKVKEIL